jgi:hypothetical protein
MRISVMEGNPSKNWDNSIRFDFSELKSYFQGS